MMKCDGVPLFLQADLNYPCTSLAICLVSDNHYSKGSPPLHRFCQIPLPDRLLQQGQSRQAAVWHDLIVRNHRDIDPRKTATVKHIAEGLVASAAP